jgi:hypothetical protein
MGKLQWFISSLVVMTGIIIFLSLFNFSGNMLYAIWFEEERYDVETYMASVDISGMSEEEAVTALREQTENWKSGQTIEVRWFEKTAVFPAEKLNFFIEESVQNMSNGEISEGDLIVSADRRELEEVIAYFSEHAGFELEADEEALREELELRASELPDENITISLHEFTVDPDGMTEEDVSTVIYQAERSYFGDQLALWLNSTEPVIIEPEENYTFSTMFTGAEMEIPSEESMSILASAVYEALLHTNFQLIERVQSDILYDTVPEGFDVRVVEYQSDLIFHNPNPVPYELYLSAENGRISAEVYGEEFPYSINVDILDHQQIEPKTIVRYSDTVPQGTENVIETGEPGLSYQLARTFTNMESEVIFEEVIANDYYPAEERVEVWSKEDYLARTTDDGTDEDEFDLDGDPARDWPDSGYDDESGYQGGSDRDGSYDGGDSDFGSGYDGRGTDDDFDHGSGGSSGEGWNRDRAGEEGDLGTGDDSDRQGWQQNGQQDRDGQQGWEDRSQDGSDTPDMREDGKQKFTPPSGIDEEGRPVKGE